MAQMPTTGCTDTPRDDRALPEHRCDSSESTGTEWIIDALGCDPKRLRDLDVIGRLCRRVIAELGLKVLGDPLLHPFPHPGGVTALYMLSESHLACHTYPELETATFNLYCCRARPPWDWDRNLRSALRSEQVRVRQISRGLATGPSQLGASAELNTEPRRGET